MNAKQMGRKGGASRSAAKRSAARRNGARGGRPQAPEALARKVREAQARLQPRLPGVDPGDLSLILECLFRRPGSGRQFFIFPTRDGRFAF